MARIRVALVFKGGVWRPDLPSYQEVPGSYLPITPALIHAGGVLFGAAAAAVLALNPSVLVDVPDADVPPGPFTDAAWKAQLDARYTEHAGTFAPIQR